MDLFYIFNPVLFHAGLYMVAFSIFNFNYFLIYVNLELQYDY